MLFYDGIYEFLCLGRIRDVTLYRFSLTATLQDLIHDLAGLFL